MWARLSGSVLLACALAACGSESSDEPGSDAGSGTDASDAGLDTGSPPDSSDAGEPDATSDGSVPVDADAGNAELVFVGDFEAPGDFDLGGAYSQFSDNVDTCEHDKTCTTDSLAIVTSPVRSGSRSVKITLRDTDTQSTSGTRAELQTGSHYETTLNEDFWYGWSIYVPTEWVNGSEQKVVHQWHTSNGNPGGSPIIGLRIDSGSWTITREFVEGDMITLWPGEPVAKGKWTDWVMHIRWSPTGTGHFTAWMNGKLVYTEEGQNMNAGTTSGGHYQKLGMYGSFGTGVTERILFYDEVRVAKGPDGYALVTPP